MLGAVVLVHGGGWYTGSRRSFDKLGSRLARAGYVAISVDYRVYGKHGTFIQAALEDVGDAFSWAAQRGADWGYSQSAVAIVGASSGGHLAACVALDCLSQNHPMYEVSSLILLNPVLDLTSADSATGFSSGELMLIGDLDTLARETLSPLYRLHELTMKTLLVYGSEDPLYGAYKNALKHSAVTLRVFDGEEHGFFNQKQMTPAFSTMLVDHLAN